MSYIFQNMKRENGFFLPKLTTQTKHKFTNELYKCMKRNRINIPMFTYFEIYASNNSIDYLS